jgi:hypothetical protein
MWDLNDLTMKHGDQKQHKFSYSRMYLDCFFCPTLNVLVQNFSGVILEKTTWNGRVIDLT